MLPKSQKIVSWWGLGLLAVAAVVSMGCGPKCPKLKSSLDESQVIGEDVDRVNKLVAKRKEAMEEATQGADASISKLKFSVTAYELAIETQLRVIKISPKFENSPLYTENRALFDEMRCYFDKLVDEGTGHILNDRIGRDIQVWSNKVDAALKKQGRLSSSELRVYFEEGIKSGAEE